MMRRMSLSAGLWLTGLALGFWCVAAVPPDFRGFAATSPLHPGWASIAINNLCVVGLAASGRFLWGVPTLLVLFNSGIALGFVLGVVPVPLGAALGVTLPHSVLEVPGLWIAGAVGFSGGSQLRVWRLLLLSVALTIGGAFVEGEYSVGQAASRAAGGRPDASRIGGGDYLRFGLGSVAGGRSGDARTRGPRAW